VSKEVHRGDIWVVDWSPGRGSEQAGMRPAVVVQTDAANLNPRYPNTIVLTVSTKGKAVPFHGKAWVAWNDLWNPDQHTPWLRNKTLPPG
jgi:hypothetical protein